MMPWALALVLLLGPHSDAPPLALRTLDAASPAPHSTALAVHFEALDLVAPARAVGVLDPPACAADVCQPRVALPGHEPQLSAPGRRTELALTMLERSRLEPLAGVARLLTRTGLRVDYAPAQLDTRTTLERGGWGRVVVGVHWRIDACGRPAWLTSG
jgi:hypothetical protein